MGKRLDEFFNGSPRFIRLGFLGFIVAAIGVGLAFSIDYEPYSLLSYVAFGITTIGVAVGFVAVGWGLISRRPNE